MKIYVNGEYRELTQKEIEEQKAQQDKFEHSLTYIQGEIQAIKDELSAYDYIGTKIAMGISTKEEYAEQIAYTETLRQKIRELEREI